jgi:uncharacterized protein YggE
MKTASFLTALAAGSIMPAAAIAQIAPTTVEPMVPAAGTVLDVTAEGRTTRVPDLATIRAGVVSQSPTAAAALTDNAQRMAKVLDALKRAGVAPVITGYQATNTVSIRFRDVAKSGTILDALVAQGANQIDGPNLSIDKPDAALDEARADAIAQAKRRADLYAKAAGLRVARIVSIAESGQDAGGPVQPMFAMARASMAKDSTQIAPGEKDVTVTLSVRFLLN